MPTFKRQVLTDALFAALSAAMAPIVGGDAKAPPIPDGAQRPPIPYWILYPLPGGGKTGAPNSDDPNNLAVWLYQVTAVGGTRGQAEFAQDKAHNAILERSGGVFVNAIMLPGGAFVGTRDHDSYGPTISEGDLWNAVELFAIGTSSPGA